MSGLASRLRPAVCPFQRILWCSIALTSVLQCNFTILESVGKRAVARDTMQAVCLSVGVPTPIVRGCIRQVDWTGRKLSTTDGLPIIRGRRLIERLGCMQAALQGKCGARKTSEVRYLPSSTQVKFTMHLIFLFLTSISLKMQLKAD